LENISRRGGEMIFVISEDLSKIEKVDSQSFVSLDVWERKHIQEWVRSHPEILGEDLLIVNMEFDKFEGSKDRLDLLAVDHEGNLVIVELKRDSLAGYADLQAVRYAAMVSNMTIEQLLAHYADYRKKITGQQTSMEELRAEINDFVELEDFEELSSKPRIILCSEDFSPEITTTVLWLRGFDLDISCVRITPYQLEDKIILVPEKIIPLKESEEYLTGIQEKEEKRQEARAKSTLEELCVKAERNGYGEGFKTILEAASRHGLCPHLYKDSVMYTSPANRAKGLFTVWAPPRGPRKLILGASHKKWAEIYALDKQTFESIMGPNGWRVTEELPLSMAEEFAAKLDRLFESIEKS
jgi:hypothetical protein